MKTMSRTAARMTIAKRGRQLALAAAVAVVAPTIALADATNDAGYTPASGQEFFVSTSGATALGAFTRANNGSPTTVPPQGTYTRSTFSLGQSQLRIGQTVYTRSGALGQFLALEDKTTSPDTEEPQAGNDRLVYQYLERGSVNGINDLVNSNGLRLPSTPLGLIPPVPTANQPLWQNGNFLGSDGASSGGYSYNSAVNPQGPVRIAWSDVRFQQAFSVPGTASADSAIATSGYGLARGAVGGSNYQQLASSTTVNGGSGSATFLRNATLAAVGFNIVANPGTGLARLTREEGKWLQATGRLPNGANFNSSTRDSGSGTRNQGALNLGLDPSWAAGERDRISLAPTYDDIDPNGNTVTIIQGASEANPERSILTGSLTPDLNERRISPTIRFSDKTSGSVLREVVVNSRMGLGILSGGDSRNSAGTALTTSTNNPMRALALDFGNGQGFNQATAANITEGRYNLWSAEQAITVSGSIGGSGTLIAAASNATGSIYQDPDDEAGLGALSSQTGIHRKFLDNITKSVATDIGNSETVRTPAEAILQAGYILPQMMNVEKPFDGQPTTLRNGGTGRSTTPPAGGGLSEQQLWDATVGNSSSALVTNNNWVDPSTQNGNLTSGDIRYNIYAQSNALNSGNANADLSVKVNSRTMLAGDMNNDGVRDLGDVPSLALAYASPQAYAATAAGSGLTSGTFSARGGSLITLPGANTTEQTVNGNLVVLTDFNSNGNIPAQSGAVSLTAVERADVKYFLYGASVDTSAYNNIATVTFNGSTKALSALENRHENGVRLGQLKKNAAIDTFNATLNGMVASVVNPATGVNYTQAQVDAMKFDKFDVNGDGVRNRADAKIVDRNVGKNYTSLSDVLGSADDLIAAELNDNNVITHVLSGGTSDFKLIRDALTPAVLLDGDANFDGTVDISDLGTLATNWQNQVDRWSLGDFDFNGLVDISDLGMLATNWQLGVVGPTGNQSFDQAMASLGLGGAQVPEPASVGLLSLGAMIVLRRRRR